MVRTPHLNRHRRANRAIVRWLRRPHPLIASLAKVLIPAVVAALLKRFTGIDLALGQLGLRAQPGQGRLQLVRRIGEEVLLLLGERAGRLAEQQDLLRGAADPTWRGLLAELTFLRALALLKEPPK